jgi:hypothetical protein
VQDLQAGRIIQIQEVGRSRHRSERVATLRLMSSEISQNRILTKDTPDSGGLSIAGDQDNMAQWIVCEFIGSRDASSRNTCHTDPALKGLIEPFGHDFSFCAK